MNLLHIEKIAINADKYRAAAGDRRTQYRYISRVSAQISWQIGGLNNSANSTKEGADEISIAPWKIEFLNELST